MEVGQVAESIQVTAQVAVLNTENGSIKGDVIVQQEIQDLPLDGRDFHRPRLYGPGRYAQVARRAGLSYECQWGAGRFD